MVSGYSTFFASFGSGVGHVSRWQYEEMVSNAPITISLPLLKTRIPELENLPVEDAASIIRHCVGADEMEQLSKRHMFQLRLFIASLFTGMLVFLLLMWRGHHGFIWAFVPTMGITLLSLPGHIFVYHIRSGRLLRRLVLRELAASGNR